MTEKRFTAGIGAANMDLHGRSRAALILRDSNPGFLHTSPGGVTRNILENLSRMGEKTTLFSAVGNDLYGREILASGEAVGMDMSHMLRCLDCGSSSYMALIDPEGDMFIGMSDMRILEHITPDWLEGQKDVLRKADAIVCDPCLTPEAAAFVAELPIKGIGEDCISIDPCNSADFPNHMTLLGAGLVNTENLKNLDRLLGKKFTFATLPLKFENSDGCSCRAVAIID